MTEQSPLPTTPKELTELLKLSTPKDPRDVDPSTLKYVIYARKSTKGDERQERSISDQIRDCINKVVSMDNIKVYGKPIEERCSAKDPDIRPEFNQMIEDINAGKIDAVIAWHPDRLSRNMKEAGIIIDLLDKGILKDLRFATSTFENNPTGKMLLGISFVLSKQYSEHLSESVTRGNKSKIEAGIFFDDMKHGYVISPDGRLSPDGNNYILIRQLFEKRLEGLSQLEIAKWLNTTAYTLRKNRKAPAAYKWDKDSVSKVLRDPVYAGVLKYGNSYSNLEDFYDFTPMVSIDEFFKINKIKEFTSSKLVSSMMSNKRENTKANLLRRIILCGYCNKPFSSGLTSKDLVKKGTIFYYNYKCETEGCEFRGKSVRANKILTYAYSFLDKHLFTTQNNYEHFVVEAREYTTAERKAVTSDIMSITKLVGNKKTEYEQAKDLVRQNPDLKEHYDLKETQKELKDLEKRLGELIAERDSLKHSVLTYKQYLELFQNLSVTLRKTHDMAVIDQVLRKFFSNFTVKTTGKGKQQRCEITHKLNEPWDGFVKSGDFDCGREKRLLLELFHYIIDNPEPAQRLLEKLRSTEAQKPKIIDGLVF